MTNKRAIEIIRIAIAEVEWDYPMDYTAAFEKAIEALEDIDKLSKSKEFFRKIAEEIKYEKLGDYAHDRYDRGFNAAIEMCARIILEALNGSGEE